MDPFEIKRYPVTSKDVETAWKLQVRWQIYFPLGLGLLLFALLIGLIIVSRTGDESAWADIALILLITLVSFLGFVGMVIVVAAAIGAIYLIREIPAPFDQTREAAYDAQAAVSQATEAATKPVIVPRAATYALISGVRYLAGIFKG